MTATQITYDVADRTAVITLDRPEARNGYTVQMADEIAQALAEAEGDTGVRVVVLTGAGDDFCVGADLSSGRFTSPGEGSAGDWVEPASRVTRPMYELHKPVIAAVRGAAVGVGSTVILPADFRIAADDSRFGFVFARRGIYPEGGSTWFLPRLVGLGRATDWMISGRLIAADEALASGLVTELQPADRVLDRALGLAAELADSVAPVSVAVIRQALRQMSALPSPQPAFDLDSQLIAGCGASPDAAEGISSFLERRAPHFPRRVPDDLPDFLPW
ncbi:enoyl-CoA hydratase-related protein [Luteipulveratus halotolerans]|uniref:Enoyl-CoA hydratase n=1 Tax=Luteipulveratus halotolerans TaxID=1631356 RepID=A0A0L6CLX0_9MICO|nr:enoyl-CoA hydratase-related protein [Luteipulveratus halotolerans]KNX38796.1 enoyl-CoA hydratase [Luteipulveratus halotolerans]